VVIIGSQELSPKEVPLQAEFPRRRNNLKRKRERSKNIIFSLKLQSEIVGPKKRSKEKLQLLER